jgi:superfamily I DNA and/or RNA helicase
VPFIVEGLASRLGPVAVRFTLDNQAYRHPLVIAAFTELDRRRKLLNFVQRKKLSLCWLMPYWESPFRRGRLDHRFGRPLSENDRMAVIIDPQQDRWRDFVCRLLTAPRKDIPQLEALRLVHLQKARRRFAVLQREEGRLIEAITRQERSARRSLRTALRQILQNAKVVICTLATACSRLVGTSHATPLLRRVTLAVLDEAGTCAERNMPVLLTLGSLQRVVAIGDHKQLQPFTKREAFNRRREPIPDGVFFRLQKVFGHRTHSLRRQYRMHQDVCSYISSTFYRGSLRTDAVVARARSAVSRMGLFWLQTRGGEAQASDPIHKGHHNPEEVRRVVEVYRHLVPREARSSCRVMVMAFYRRQLAHLRRAFAEEGLEESGVPSRGLRILSVDQSQGSEADLVIVSCTRSNADGNLGFLTIRNRLNVAVSRARCRLVVVGDDTTLSQGGAMWQDLIDACQSVRHAADMPHLVWPALDDALPVGH